MKIGIALAALLLAAPALAQEDSIELKDLEVGPQDQVLCSEYLKSGEVAQAIFSSGMLAGMRLAWSNVDVMTRAGAPSWLTPEARSGVESGMLVVKRDLLEAMQTGWPSRETGTLQIHAACQKAPQAPVFAVVYNEILDAARRKRGIDE